MLSSNLAGTYQRYKEDTNAIATYLVVTAKSFGYNLLPDDNSVQKPPKNKNKNKPKSNKSKTKAKSNKKQLRDAARRVPQQQRVQVLPIKEFLSLAAYITARIKSPYKVPLSVLSTLKRAIDARRKSNLWFKTNEANEESDEGHVHFIGILEGVYDILKPHSQALHQVETDEDLEIDNIFANLELEEPSEAFLNSPGTKPELKEPRKKYEAESMEEKFEMLFAAFSLFDDIFRIYGFVRNLWDQYHTGKSDLITVSVTSNTAIDMVRRLEQEFFKQFSSAKEPKEVINMLFHIKCLQQGVLPDPKPAHVGSVPFNIDMYETATFLLMDMLSLVSSFADVVTPKHTPIYRQGFFGTYDPKTDRAKMSNVQQFQEDKIIFAAAFTDLCFLAKCKDNIPAEDELTRGIRIMVNDRKIHIWTLFAARLFIDVHHLLRADIGIPFKQLQELGSKIKDTWNTTLRFRGSLELSTWPPHNDMVIEETMIKLIDEWLFEDRIQLTMKRTVRNVPVPDGDFHLFRQHPLLCGLFAFSLRMRFHEYGVDYANAWGAVLYTSHLYNAVQQEGYCQKPWMDLEMLIGTQTPEKVFVGGKPTNTDAYLKHFSLCMGHSVTQYARDRRRQGTVAARGGPRGLSTVGQVTTILRDRYCENAELHDSSLEAIEQVINANYEVDLDTEDDAEAAEPGLLFINLKTRDKKQAKEHLRKKVKHSAQLSLVEMLYALSVSISREAPLLAFDYFELHRTCWMVLDILQKLLHERILKYYSPGYLETKTQLPWVVGYIFRVASEGQHASMQLPGLKKLLRGATLGDELLACAGARLQYLIEDETMGTQMDLQVQNVAWQGRMMFPVEDADGNVVKVGTKIDLGEYELILQGDDRAGQV